MSKLDTIILQCANKAMDGKEEKLGDYIDPTKREIKDLMLDLINGTDEVGIMSYVDALRQKVEAL